jgi:hypothetical protein
MNKGFVLVCFLFVTASIHAAPSAAEEKIKVIRAQYSEIEASLKQCRQVKRDLPGESAEGGELTGYFKNSSLLKLAAKFYGETGNALEEYYFWNGRLVFVLRTESRYTAPMSGRVQSKSEERFYFDDDKLIRWLDAKKKPVALTEQAEERSRELLAQARKYSTLLNRGKE